MGGGWGEGVQNCPKLRDVIYGWPLTSKNKVWYYKFRFMNDSHSCDVLVIILSIFLNLCHQWNDVGISGWSASNHVFRNVQSGNLIQSHSPRWPVLRPPVSGQCHVVPAVRKCHFDNRQIDCRTVFESRCVGGTSLRLPRRTARPGRARTSSSSSSGWGWRPPWCGRDRCWWPRSRFASSARDLAVLACSLKCEINQMFQNTKHLRKLIAKTTNIRKL